MKTKTVMSRLAAAALAAALMLVMTIAAYAETYYNVRDDSISLLLPETWEVEEYDEEIVGEGELEHVFDAGDPEGSLHMEMYYSFEPTDEYLYLRDSEEDTLNYYEKYGEKVLEQLIYDVKNEAGAALEQAGYFNGEWNSFVVVPVDTDKNGQAEQMIYLTARMTDDSAKLCHQIMIFDNMDGSALSDADKEQAEKVADGFYDYDYYNVIAGSMPERYTDYKGDSDDNIIGSVISIIVPLAVLIVLLIKLSKKIRSRRSQSGQINQSSKSSKSGQIIQSIRPDSSGRWEDAAEQRYIRSLETLRKSGLLTKAEMQEMVNKHKRL